MVVVGNNEMDGLKKEAEYLSKDIRGAQKKTIKDAGHFPNLEQPRQFNDVVINWLRKNL